MRSKYRGTFVVHAKLTEEKKKNAMKAEVSQSETISMEVVVFSWRKRKKQHRRHCMEKTQKNGWIDLEMQNEKDATFSFRV